LVVKLYCGDDTVGDKGLLRMITDGYRMYGTQLHSTVV